MRNILNDFANGSFLFHKIAKYKVISLYNANFATFRAYETLRKHIFIKVHQYNCKYNSYEKFHGYCYCQKKIGSLLITLIYEHLLKVKVM